MAVDLVKTAGVGTNAAGASKTAVAAKPPPSGCILVHMKGLVGDNYVRRCSTAGALEPRRVSLTSAPKESVSGFARLSKLADERSADAASDVAGTNKATSVAPPLSAAASRPLWEVWHSAISSPPLAPGALPASAKGVVEGFQVESCNPPRASNATSGTFAASAARVGRRLIDNPI